MLNKRRCDTTLNTGYRNLLTNYFLSIYRYVYVVQYSVSVTRQKPHEINSVDSLEMNINDNV